MTISNDNNNNMTIESVIVHLFTKNTINLERKNKTSVYVTLTILYTEIIGCSVILERNLRTSNTFRKNIKIWKRWDF